MQLSSVILGSNWAKFKILPQLPSPGLTLSSGAAPAVTGWHGVGVNLSTLALPGPVSPHPVMANFTSPLGWATAPTQVVKHYSGCFCGGVLG